MGPRALSSSVPALMSGDQRWGGQAPAPEENPKPHGGGCSLWVGPQPPDCLRINLITAHDQEPGRGSGEALQPPPWQVSLGAEALGGRMEKAGAGDRLIQRYGAGGPEATPLPVQEAWAEGPWGRG